jgi:UDP-2,3-diacylglucosamine hydrolase
LKRHYFVSDLHLGTRDDRGRRAGFFSFLESLRRDAGVLYLLGDVFEFGFEYRDGIGASNAEIAQALTRLTAAGIKVVLVKGNHDCWLGARFQQDYGVEVRESPLVCEIAGRRAYLSHGDELDRSLKNLFFRSLFRSRVATALFGRIPARVGRFLALWVAGVSRVLEPRPDLVRRFDEFAQSRVALGDELVVLAHIHKACLRQFDRGVYLNPGDWVRHRSYGVLDDQGLRLESWPGTGHAA